MNIYFSLSILFRGFITFHPSWHFRLKQYMLVKSLVTNYRYQCSLSLFTFVVYLTLYHFLKVIQKYKYIQTSLQNRTRNSWAACQWAIRPLAGFRNTLGLKDSSELKSHGLFLLMVKVETPRRNYPSHPVGAFSSLICYSQPNELSFWQTVHFED